MRLFRNGFLLDMGFIDIALIIAPWFFGGHVFLRQGGMRRGIQWNTDRRKFWFLNYDARNANIDWNA